MAEHRQKLRGTTIELDQALGSQGLLAYDIDREELRVYDGILLGGYRIPNSLTLAGLYTLPPRLDVKGKPLLTAAQSANNATEAGFYNLDYNTTDQPEAGRGSLVVATMDNGALLSQIWQGGDPARAYIRNRLSTLAWNSWNRLVDKNYLLTNSEAVSYDAARLGGQLPAYYTAINARLGYTAANKAGEAFTGNVSVGGTFGATGAATFASTLAAGATTLASATITGNATVGGTFGATGAATFGNTLSTVGKATLASLGVTGAATVGGSLTVTGAATLNTTLAVSGVSTLAALTATTGMFTTTVTTGPGDGAVDGTALLTLSGDRPWTIRQRGIDGTANLSFENTTGKRIEFSSDAVYAGGNIILIPTATPSIQIGGGTVWHTGNDGAGSGLDADTVDGYHVASLYRNNAAFSTTGNLVITNAAPEIKLLDSTAGQYSARMRVDANNVYFDSSTDDITFGEVFRFELDTKNGYANGSLIWTDANTTSARIIAELGYTPANVANTVNAGNGLTGGGALNSNPTVTLGTPTSISNSSTNSVTATSHTHALAFTAAEVYTGNVANVTDLPVGTIVGVVGAPTRDRHALGGVWLDASADRFSGTSGQPALTGTWRNRGILSTGNYIYQRVA